MSDERVTTAVVVPEDEEFDGSLRPRSLDEFVGQERIKEQLGIVLEAAKGRGEALDHVLLVGPPGLGKTSLAYIIREELGVGIRSVAGPALERKGDMAAILTSLEERDVLFVDEIHRLNRAVEEILYPALEDYRLDIIVGQGPAARTLTLDLPPFTLVGATTRTGLLTTPLRDRFGMTYRLDYYGAEDLARIVRRSARILGVEIEDEAAEEISRRARGTPRVANRILRRVRDVAQVRHDGAVTIAIAQEALGLLEVDGEGLERIDRELLRAILDKFDGGPVGLSTLAVSLGEETDTIEDVYEPYLLQLGLIQRTPRGRVITKLGRAHVGRGGQGRVQPFLAEFGLLKVGQKLDAVPERVARVEAPAALDPLVPLDVVAVRGEPFRDLVELHRAPDTESRVRALRRKVRVVRSEVKLLAACLEPDAAGALEALRPLNLLEPEHLSVEAPCRVLASVLNSEEGVVEPDDHRRYWSSCQEGTGASSSSARPPRGSR